jgi:hypothetical protein
MERMNGEIRDRGKIVRGSHLGLDGTTPAEKAGIEVQGGNKWLTLIQNASKERQQKS